MWGVELPFLTVCLVCLKQPDFVWVPLCWGFWLQVQWGWGWERCCCYLCLVGVPCLLCPGEKYPCWELGQGSLSPAHLLMCAGHWECWLHPAGDATFEPSCSFLGEWDMLQPEPRASLLASCQQCTKEKDGGQMTSTRSCWFCFKEHLLFSWWQEQAQYWGFRCFGILEILFCIISLAWPVFVPGVILMLHNWEKIRTIKSCVRSQIQKKTEPTCCSLGSQQGASTREGLMLGFRHNERWVRSGVCVLLKEK